MADFITTIDEYGELVVSCDGPEPQGDFVLPSWDLAASDGIELWSGAGEDVWPPDERLAYEDPPDATWPAGESELWS